MKPASISIICLAVVLLLISCEQEPQLEDYAVQKVDNRLSDDEVLSAFNALGLSLERFRCMFPKKAGIQVSSETFVNGQPFGGNTKGTLYVDKGLQEFILFKKESEDNTVKFSLSYRGGTIGCGSASVKGFQSKTCGALPAKNLTQTQQPIFLYAANKNGIEGFSTTSVDIKTLIDKYDFVMVIYASIEER